MPNPLEMPFEQFSEMYLAPAVKGLADKMKRNEELSPLELSIVESIFGLPHDPNRQFIISKPSRPTP